MREAARADPANRESRIALLSVYDKSARYREAAEIVAELETWEPQEPKHRLTRGILLVRLEEFPTAEQEFRRALELVPEEADGYAKLAWMFLLQGTRLPEARDLAQSAIRRQPQEVSHYQLLAQLCERLGDRPAAVAALEQALDSSRATSASNRKGPSSSASRNPDHMTSTNSPPPGAGDARAANMGHRDRGRPGHARVRRGLPAAAADGWPPPALARGGSRPGLPSRVRPGPPGGPRADRACATCSPRPGSRSATRMAAAGNATSSRR